MQNFYQLIKIRFIFSDRSHFRILSNCILIKLPVLFYVSSPALTKFLGDARLLVHGIFTLFFPRKENFHWSQGFFLRRNSFTWDTKLHIPFGNF